jgi:hypothetical protein
MPECNGELEQLYDAIAAPRVCPQQSLPKRMEQTSLLGLSSIYPMGR